MLQILGGLIMTREEARQAAEVLQAFADGKEIEMSSKGENRWSKIDCKSGECRFDFESKDYRIAKEPQYRPFANAEECWNEMLKHQPFGWMKGKRRGERTAFIDLGDGYWFTDMFEKMTFADGEPFGVKIE